MSAKQGSSLGGLPPPSNSHYKGYYRSPSEVDRISDIWGSYYNMPKAIFYLLKGDHKYSGVLL